MPMYCYKCPKCPELMEEIRRMKDRNRLPACPAGCGKMERNLGLELCNTDTQNWDKEVLSERMGISPAQVPQYRKAFPNIPITDGGQIIVTNGAEERRINKHLAAEFAPR